MLIRWAFVLAITTTLIGWATALAFAAPAAIECRSVAFTAPPPGSTVSGAVEIQGRAVIPNFQFYKVEYSPLGRDAWVLIGTDVTRAPIENGRLAVWQTTIVPDGTYRIRLHVVDVTGNYCELVLEPVQVSNVLPPEPEPPEATETPMLTVVPPQPTPTPSVGIVVEFLPAPSTPGALPSRSAGVSSSDLVLTLIYFLFGAFGMLAIVLSIAVVLFVRNLKSNL